MQLNRIHLEKLYLIKEVCHLQELWNFYFRNKMMQLMKISKVIMKRKTHRFKLNKILLIIILVIFLIRKTKNL